LSARFRYGRALALGLLMIAYFTAGVLHVLKPGPFLGITPHWVPWPGQVILVTGLCEIAGAIGLAIPRTRRLAGIMLALYAVCVYPANIVHAEQHFATGRGPGLWYHIPRLLAQPVIVWWALFAGEVTVWPFRRR
jgi:uncharacterized membrane protein